MTIEEVLQRLGRSDWTPVGGPVAETKLQTTTDLYGNQKSSIVETGNYTLTISRAGRNQVITLTPAAEGGGWDVTEPPKDVPTEGVETTAQAAQRTSEAQAAQALADQRKAEAAERDRNYQEGRGRLTDAEVARLQQEAAQQNLTADQIAVRRQELEQTGRQRDRELGIQEANSRIAAANSALAARRADIENQVAQGRLSLDEAKQAYQVSKDARDNDLQQQSLAIRQLEQQATTAYQQGQLTLGQQQLAQRQAEAAQTAETAARTAATTAATSIYGAERTAQTGAGTIGQNLLANRATAANNLLTGVLGLAGTAAQRSGNMGGGLMSVPAGLGEQLVGGVLGTTAQQFGGQDTLNAAARMVQGARPGAELTPQGQLAVGVLSQMLEHYQRLTGQPHPAVAATAAANQTPPNGGGFTSPAMSALPSGMDTSWLFGNPASPIANPANTPNQPAFAAPVTAPAPTININV